MPKKGIRKRSAGDEELDAVINQAVNDATRADHRRLTLRWPSGNTERMWCLPTNPVAGVAAVILTNMPLWPKYRLYDIVDDTAATAGKILYRAFPERLVFEMEGGADVLVRLKILEAVGAYPANGALGVKVSFFNEVVGSALLHHAYSARREINDVADRICATGVVSMVYRSRYDEATDESTYTSVGSSTKRRKDPAS